jgi:hypothetical protein
MTSDELRPTPGSASPDQRQRAVMRSPFSRSPITGSCRTATLARWSFVEPSK